MADNPQPFGGKSVGRMVRRRMGHAFEIRHALQGYRPVAGGDCGHLRTWPWNGFGGGPCADRHGARSRRLDRGILHRGRRSPLGVAGGELLIPTLVLLFGADIKLAGSLSLAESLPTMIVGFARYSRDQSFTVLGRNKTFVLIMAAGSVVGTFIGGQLLGIVPEGVLLPALGVILIVSAFKVWQHR